MPATLASAAPQCSLLVLTYNQARFIAEALDAALAQTGVVAEIIVSDDASSDATFDIARERVAAHDGPHRVVLSRNPANMGVIGHTNKVVAMATTDILIPCYGDDIAFPTRAARIVETFARHAPLLTHSHAVAIDETGARVAPGYGKAAFFRSTDPLAVAASRAHYLGASGAWHRALFDKYGPIRSPLVYDDHVLGFRAALEGRVRLIDEPLLYYRAGIGISNLRRADESRAANRARRMKILRQAVAIYDERAGDARHFGLGENDPVSRALEDARFRSAVRLAWHEDRAALMRRVARRPGAGLAALAGEVLRDLRNR
ncbi:MAG: glycosyltransferase [Roseovarius sp.]|nr:glycosyltransferase [Roseovarius sp.]